MMVLLYAEFGLLRQVFLIIGVVPLATLGELIALYATGTTLSTSRRASALSRSSASR